MSYQHTENVMNHSKTTGAARAVLLVLAIRADSAGVSWPSLDRLARDAGLTRRAIIRILPRLAEAGELSIAHGDQQVRTGGGKQAVNRYTVILQGGDRESPPDATREGPTVTTGSDPRSPQVVTHGPKGRDPRSPEYKGNCKVNKKLTTNGGGEASHGSKARQL